MKILFDSHALVWFLIGDRRLPKRLRVSIEQPETAVFVSAICAWEIAIKVARHKWPEAVNIPEMIERLVAGKTFLPLPVTLQHARVAGFLPGRHRDPFDRMLAAQARVEGISLATADPVFEQFGVAVVW